MIKQIDVLPEEGEMNVKTEMNVPPEEIIQEFTTRQIYAILFQKEFYPCNRFEIGNNNNKKVFNCHSELKIKELLESFEEDEYHLINEYLNSYPAPRIIVHGKDYDKTYRYHYKEPKKDDDNRYNLDLEEMDKKVKEIAKRYLEDGFGTINLLSVI